MYPITISNGGKTVEPLVKKAPPAITYASNGAASKEDIIKGLELCEHSGFVPGAKVKLKKDIKGFAYENMVVVSLRTPHESVYRWYGSTKKGIESLSLIRVKCTESTVITYSIEELDLV